MSAPVPKPNPAGWLTWAAFFVLGSLWLIGRVWGMAFKALAWPGDALCEVSLKGIEAIDRLGW